MLNEMLFLCDAIYRGSEALEGAVSPTKLTALVDLVLTTQEPGKEYSHVCIDKLQIDEERLRISKSRRDEGFESDSESSSTASGSLIEENVCGSPEIKVIQDHVLRLEKLLRQDSGIHHCTTKLPSDGGSASISSSSGAESEEEAPKRPENVDFSINVTSEEDSRRVAAIQADNGNGDHFLLSDILFCHVMTHRPKIVTIVVKSIDSHLVTAHLFECLSQEAARTLYNCYYTASNKYKLNRYRKSKRRIELFDTEQKALLDRIHVSIRNVNKKKYTGEEPYFRESQSKSKLNGRLDENEINIRKTFKNEFNGDTTNINIIEIKDSHLPVRIPNGMLQKTDENGVTHIEIESAPCSMIDSVQELRTTFDSQEVLSALDRLSLHSVFNPESYLNSIGVTGSCPNSITEASREIYATGDKEREKKLRQRQPPLLLKKDNYRRMDNLPRKEIRKAERKSRIGGEEQIQEKTQCLSEQYFSNINSNPNKEIQRNKELENISETVDSTESYPTNSERQSRLRNTSKDKGKFRSNHNKGPAPPPPKTHTNNPSLILVPTKSGQEKTKSYYPKESHIVRGSKLIRIDYPLYPPWNMNSDINNNPKRLYYAHRNWVSSNEYHSNRYKDNSSFSSEIRKRSRSKSPARRPMSHRYIDVVSTFNLSQKIKEFSDNVIQSLKNNAQSSQTTSPFITSRDTQERTTFKREKKVSSDSQSSNNSNALRPVIKRGKKTDCNNQDSKRVTFSAYATVQLMET
ncbi:hypothetical protein Anas_04268 [Armadillidium nasatum]|uniref:Uncharacterized protein n=1 Tax=Armadillidium nasatum TaxID=96803 RepID=A0A5N5TJT7_9CRUS|nr:hypothetical protein Anas_04268 [Armadillidium nasatum]